MQIKQNTATINLVFFMADESDHVTGKESLSPSVNLSKNGGAFDPPVGAVTEIGEGFYKVAANAADTNTIGILALSATATGADQAAMAFEIVANIESDSIAAIAALNNLSAAGVRSELATELARIDATISSRNATTPPDATAIQAAAAAALTAYDPPTRTEATADKNEIIAEYPSIAEIIGAAGGLTSETVAALEAADQIFLASPYVPDESPVLVIPAPDTDESLTVCYIYTEDITNEKHAGIVLTFSLVSTPAKSERVLETASKTATTDADGYAQISLQSGLRYRVTCAALGLEKTFTPTGETYDLKTLIP